jgi:hypothetical protein
MEGLTDGWTEGLTDGWMEGLTDGWMEGLTDEWTEGLTDGWTEGLTDGRTDRQKLRKKERKTDGRTYVEFFHPTALAAIRECL